MTRVSYIQAQTQFAEDSGHTSTDEGTQVLAVRNDTMSALAGTTGDYIPFQTDSSGRVRIIEEQIATDGMSNARNLGATATGQVLVNAACTVYELSIDNGDSGTIYVKIYDKATAPTSSDTPVRTYVLATLVGRTIHFPKGLKFTAGCSVRAVTTIADNGNTGATASTIHAAVSYK